MSVADPGNLAQSLKEIERFSREGHYGKAVHVCDKGMGKSAHESAELTERVLL